MNGKRNIGAVPFLNHYQNILKTVRKGDRHFCAVRLRTWYKVCYNRGNESEEAGVHERDSGKKLQALSKIL